MASNRYTSVNWNAPMSSYVPLPLDALNRVGATMEKRYDDSVQEAYKLNDLMATVNAIDEHKPFKKALENKYYPQMQEITDRIVNKGDLEAKRDLNRLARQWMNDPLRQELEKSYQDYNTDVKNVTKLKEEGKYSGITGYDPFVGYKGSDESGNINPYRTKGARPIQDYLKVGTSLMEDIKASGSNGKSYKIDNSGNVIGLESGWKAVYDRDVDRVAKNSVLPFLKSNEGQYFIDEYRHNNPNASGEEITNASYKYLKQLGNKQIFKETEYGQDFKYSPWAADAWKAGNKKQETLDALTSSTEESKTANAIHSDTQFSSLFDTDVFKEKNGVVTFDPKAILKNPEVKQGYTTGSMGSYMGSGATLNKLSPNQKADALNNQILKMSKAIGVDPKSLSTDGKLDATKVSQLATAYNSLAKFRALDLNMSALASNSESELATKNWNNIVKLNPETGKPTDNKDFNLQGGDKVKAVTRRVINGKTYIEGYIEKKDGTERIPVMYRPNTIEKNKVFDGLAELQQLSIDNLSKDKVQYHGDFNIPGLNLGANMKIEGKSAIGQGKYVMSVVDPNNKMNNKYVLLNDKNQILDIKNSLGDMKKVVEQHYYENIPEGQSELQVLLNNKDLYKENEGQ